MQDPVANLNPNSDPRTTEVDSDDDLPLATHPPLVYTKDTQNTIATTVRMSNWRIVAASSVSGNSQPVTDLSDKASMRP